jgi:hypothetical protein
MSRDFLEYSPDHMWQLADDYVPDCIFRRIEIEKHMVIIFWTYASRLLLNGSHPVYYLTANTSVILLLLSSRKNFNLTWEYHNKDDFLHMDNAKLQNS